MHYPDLAVCDYFGVGGALLQEIEDYFGEISEADGGSGSVGRLHSNKCLLAVAEGPVARACRAR